ncbi:MAG: DEAD/DEAH box helicase [Phycisphaerae bacterium]|nr:MAG: DEAD/DEAH box helicase [Planctomycetota bacterium]KAB2940622.1 MAG: DEAD/DEAH box helicase [Phycisphaerae bacterium]MBE7458744.1 DEAD/DEAH box helicase [Planctomycetia bacterium]MCK6465635.1 DEAD/DEAH box helicase [Phycisphaerae bacterium]MCL4720204.1 DEAD/DEAH box helicase [Phycisphaerae bacterium]
MIEVRLHAIWTRDALQVWGEDFQALRARAASPAGAADSAAPHPFALPHEALRDVLGDAGAPLLAGEAPAAHLTLRLPSDERGPHPSVGSEPGRGLIEGEGGLRDWVVPTLVLGPLDALDWLTTTAPSVVSTVFSAASVQFWRRCARLVLERVARQRFVPDLTETAPGRIEALWRCVVDPELMRTQVGPLAAAIPAVCRSVAGTTGGGEVGIELVESFLRVVTDAFIRRCLAEDDLAEAVRDRSRGDMSAELRWLTALVDGASVVQGTSEEQRDLLERVRGWVSRVDPAWGRSPFRTLLRLHAPSDDGDGADPEEPAARDWRLTIHLQSLEAPSLVLDAGGVPDYEQRTGRLLRRSGESLLERLRSDVRIAARHFPPLSALVDAPLPESCALDVHEAHQFLRRAMPMLALEGIGVVVPSWWTARRPQVGLSVNLRPASPEAGAAFRVGIESLVSFDWRLAVGDRELGADDVRDLIRRGQPLTRIGGEWIEVEPDALEQALDLLSRPHAESATLADVLRHTFYEERGPSGLPVLDVRATGWLGGLFAEGSATFELMSPPESFAGTLRPYQVRGLSWLAFLDRHGLGACLADDMGLGKTIQLIALLLHERVATAPGDHAGAADAAPVGPTLIIVPMSVVGNWQHELRRFAPSLRVLVHHGLERLTGEAFAQEVARHDVVISTYGLAHRDFEHLDRVAWRRIVLDEAQNIKNPGAKQSVAVRRLRGERRVALTGTPIENRLGELWSIFDFLNPSLLGTIGEFRRVFASPIERQADARRSARLRRLIRPFLLRRGKTDPDVDVDLPEKLEMTVFCNLTREQALLYERVTSQMLGQIDEAGGIRRKGLILTAILKLKQVCNHPAQFLGETRGESERSGKCRRIVEMVEEVVAEGERALIFTQFRRMGDLLERMLAAALDRPILFLHGGTPEPRRRELVDRFQQEREDAPILLLSLKAGGVGLNLTAASHVFHFDRWWNPAVENQATDRAHRIGQHRKVQVHKFICVGTLEERIDAMLRHKKDLADAIIGSGEDWLTELSTEGLRDLFRLSREAVSD